MELRVLNYFLAVAREENITKAAQSLHIVHLAGILARKISPTTAAFIEHARSYTKSISADSL